MTSIPAPDIPTRRQLHPLQVNDKTGEVYLRLPAPLDKFIVTPARKTDVADIMKAINNPEVYYWLAGPPIPYLTEHAEEWLSRGIKESNDVLRELEGCEEPDLKLVEGCPLSTIREEKEDGTDAFVGDMTLKRCCWMEYSAGATKEDKERLEEANKKLPLGDPEIIWTMGDYLAPEYHRRGIMAAAIGTVLQQWAIPRMGVRRMLVTACKGNYGSVRVFEKNGFKLRETRENCTVVRGRESRDACARVGVCGKIDFAGKQR